MTPITTIEETKNFKSRDLIPLKCEVCNNTFNRPKNRILDNFSKVGKLISVCSPKCSGIKKQITPIEFKCKQCGCNFTRKRDELKKKSKFRFCSYSCNATYWNAHKTSGTQRSKLEKWIEQQLVITFPNLQIHYNKTDAISAELDIYIPSLKLAFELNGIFHYEPVFGEDKLKYIQNNDNRKFQACSERKIELCIIDTHNTKYLKKERDKKFLDIIVNLIENKLALYPRLALGTAA